MTIQFSTVLVVMAALAPACLAGFDDCDVTLKQVDCKSDLASYMIGSQCYTVLLCDEEVPLFVEDDGIGKRASGFLRIGKRASGFLRIGKRASGFLRIGKRSAEAGDEEANRNVEKRASGFLRIGRGDMSQPAIVDDNDMLLMPSDGFLRRERASGFLRIGRR